MQRTKRLPFLILSLFVIGGGLALLYLIVRILDVPSSAVQQWTDLDSEGSVASWFSSMQLLLPAFLLAPLIISRFARRRGHVWALLALALVFMFLSADESVGFHEWLGHLSDTLLPDADRTTTAFGVTGIWMFLLGVPLIIVLGLLLLRLRNEFRRVPGVMARFVTGAIIWLGGALGIETLSNFVRPGEIDLDIAEVFVEETLEMTGVTVMVWALYMLLMGLGFRWQLAKETGPEART